MTEGGPAEERFERLALLGQGGMARVWKVRDRATGQLLALKEILGEQDAHAVERLRREAASARSLQHPHICRAVDFHIADDDHWIAFELVEGLALRDVIRELCPLPPSLALALLHQLLLALSYAHNHGVVHRDVKPRNIMVTRDGTLKLLDFGVARRIEDATMTMTGALVGTPAYMSPEQAMGQPLDGRTDLFAAGLVLHEMFTGTSPYVANELAVTLTRILMHPVAPLAEVAPWTPASLQAVHASLTQHAVDERCPTADVACALIERDVGAVDPSLLARAMADLPRARGEGHASLRRELLNDADFLLAQGRAEAALLRLDALCQFDGDDEDARRRRNRLAKAHGYFFDIEDEEDLLLLKQQVDAQAPPVIFRRLADLYRARRRLAEHARWLRRYCLAQPKDTLARGQLAALEGPPRPPSFRSRAPSDASAPPMGPQTSAFVPPAPETATEISAPDGPEPAREKQEPGSLGAIGLFDKRPDATALDGGAREQGAPESEALDPTVLDPPPKGAAPLRRTKATAMAATRASERFVGLRELSHEEAPPGALATRDLLGTIAPRRPGLGQRTATGSAAARSVEPPPVVIVPTAGPDDGASAAHGRFLALSLWGVVIIGGLFFFAAPAWRRAQTAPGLETTEAVRAPTGAEMVDVAPLLAEARVQWSNGDAVGVVQTTTRVLGLVHETFIVDRREAACLRARAYARLGRRDEARADAQQCIDWQVSSSSPEIEEMRAIVTGGSAF
jgi:hypothetical protein